MREGKQAYHQVLKDIETLTRTKPYSSRFAERTTWMSDVHPPTADNEHALDWREFLLHSRFDHDVAACSYCMRSVDLGPFPAPLVAGTFVATQDLSSFRQQSASSLTDKWSRCKSLLNNLRQSRVDLRSSSKPVPQLARGAIGERAVVAELPPVLPALPCFSPLLEGCDIRV